MVWGAGNSDLAKLLPRLQDLDISNTLLSSWESIAQITRQLPSLRFLNISGNKLKLPNNPDELQESVCHITHLVLNNMKGYTWSDLMTCCVMFPTLRKLQIAFNKLCKLGPVPVGLFDSLEEIDIGVNPICSWEEVCHLGTIPRTKSRQENAGIKLNRIRVRLAAALWHAFCTPREVPLPPSPQRHCLSRGGTAGPRNFCCAPRKSLGRRA
ncbi:Tubulin-specific chaperone E [Penaeus vannamei]|uniref:Tubulin-specific chaperone E n=1 Tax=Penaeus vannamei TaxID=6689 RepID=A0A3R7QAI9_PENVA|nr:Tubulin-specific chaperone E [Penaeus vannamei]